MMTRRRAFYHRAETCQKSVAFFKREGVWTYERLAAEVERLARKGSRAQPGIGAAAVDTQERTLERVTPCAA